jgi:hypothetical protein
MDAFEASEHFITHATPVRLRSSAYGVTAVRPFTLWLFVQKQGEQLALAVNNQLRVFKLHDESIIDFDPGGRFGSFLPFSVHNILRHTSF